jgi:hypothetical protein
MAQSSVKQLGEFFNKNYSHTALICELFFNSIRKQKKLLFVLFVEHKSFRSQVAPFKTDV